AYAVLKHRVFDIQYFVNRALVYALTASILVVAVGFVEWFISELIAEQHLALSLTAAASIGIGVLISKLHQRGERLLDRLVFRARYRAGAYFARLGRSLGEADEPATIGEALVADACEELGLSSAALFALDGTTQAYLRANSRGWPATCANELAHDDKLVRALRSELEFVRTADLRWHHDGLPEGHAQPTLAVPVRIGTNLLALVLYGPHENGADLDPDEARLLLRLADAAAIAYVRVRARERDGELAELRAQLAGRSLAPSG
ncbi:MAG: GAF domain-containing protein, partial [Vulcanimicrobiaceae bacterium]